MCKCALRKGTKTVLVHCCIHKCNVRSIKQTLPQWYGGGNSSSRSSSSSSSSSSRSSSGGGGSDSSNSSSSGFIGHLPWGWEQTILGVRALGKMYCESVKFYSNIKFGNKLQAETSPFLKQIPDSVHLVGIRRVLWQNHISIRQLDSL